MLDQIRNAVVTFQAIGLTTPARLSGRPCQIAFSGGSVAEIEVVENQISSTQPVRSFSFTLPCERLASVPGIQTLLAAYSGPLTISELVTGGPVIESEKVDVIAILYLAVPTVEFLSHSTSLMAEIMISGGRTFTSPARVLSRPLAGCGVRIDEPAKITLPLAEALMADEECLIELR